MGAPHRIDADPAPPLALCKGRFSARLAVTASEIEAAMDLRARVFRGGASDLDAFDALCQHVVIEDLRDGALVGYFRLLHLSSGAEITRSYSAQFYGVQNLASFHGPMVEMGRFCIDPDRFDADILRVAWGALTAFVDAQGVEMLFGCSSLEGTDPAAHLDTFARLRARHLAPSKWQPEVRAPRVHDFAKDTRDAPDLKAGLAQMPPLLRTYVAMGGWVSDHAVIDDDLGTLHVFTALEIRAVPPARARLLRSMAANTSTA